MELTTPILRRRIAVFRWALPLLFILLAVLYQLVLARWVHDAFGDNTHFAVEILFYGTAAPLLSFWAMTLVDRWLEEKERVEKLAQASERRLASITAASADAILSLDPAGLIESWNRGAELLFGYTFEQVRGKPLTALLGGGESSEVEFSWLLENARQHGFVRGHETACRNDAGQTILVELTATYLTDPTGRPFGFSVILRDITLRKQREQEIQRLNTKLNEQVAERTRDLAEKVEALARANSELQKLDQMRSEFVSLVSHQLRGPLTNMRGAVERITTNCHVMNATCSRMFVILNQQVERLDRLVREVLSAAQIESGRLALHPEPVSLLPLVNQVAEQVRARTSGRAFHLSTKPGLPPVFADRDRTMEILVNLFDNADKYTPAGSDISIEVSADETEVTLSVRDHGPGLPSGDLERVFDKFYRTDGSDAQLAYGYGLGLYICRRLVEAQNGRIWVENAPDGGAVFTFTLPVANA